MLNLTSFFFISLEISLWSWIALSVLDGGTSRATHYPYKAFLWPRETNQCAVEQIDGDASQSIQEQKCDSGKNLRWKKRNIFSHPCVVVMPNLICDMRHFGRACLKFTCTDLSWLACALHSHGAENQNTINTVFCEGAPVCGIIITGISMTTESLQLGNHCGVLCSFASKKLPVDEVWHVWMPCL